MLVIDEDLCKKALEYATSKHEGQTRIEGKPYITHPVAVAQIVRDWGYGTDYIITALFHDLLEDTDATEDEIAAIGGPEVLKAVILLTKKKGYVMSEYTKAIQENKIAYVVKTADRLHNLRSAINTDTNFKRRYILETVDWYLDFSPEIPKAVQKLVKSVNPPLAELSFLQGPVNTWKTYRQNTNP